MSQLKLSGILKQELTRTSNHNNKMYYIYQFETKDNNDYIEIIDVYSHSKIKDAKVGELLEVPVQVSLRDSSILFELKTKNLEG